MKLYNYRILHILCTLLTVSLLASCGPYKTKDLATNLSDIQLYQKALANIKAENYSNAMQALTTFEARFPFSKLVPQAQLEIIYIHIKQQDTPLAIAAADRFIRMHPEHPNLDYALYLKGLALHNSYFTTITRYLPTSSNSIDTINYKFAFSTFEQLVKQYPNSNYVNDATQRMRSLQNTLAKHELKIALYYMKRKAYVAAINRAQNIIYTFLTPPVLDNALAIIISGYKHLQLTEPANEALTILYLNYPNSQYIKRKKSSIYFRAYNTEIEIPPQIIKKSNLQKINIKQQIEHFKKIQQKK